MPFQGIKTDGDTDMLSLALQIRAMRMQEEQAKEEMRLKKLTTIADIEAAKEQARRDGIKFDLDVMEKKAKLGLDARTDEMGMGQTLDLVNDTQATPDQRYAAARQIDQFVQSQGSQFQRAPEMVGANIGAGRGLMLQKERLTEAVKEGDANRAFRFSEASAEADLRRQNRIEELRAKREQALAKTEGLFNGEAMRNTRQIFKTELEPAKATEKAWNFYNKFDPNNKQQIIDAVQLAQRAIDPVNVTEGDMRLRVAAGLDSQGALMRRMEEWGTGAIAIPKELGQVIKDNLREKLESADDVNFMTINSQDRYIAANGFDESQRNFVLQDLDFRERIKKRVASRGRPAVDSAAPDDAAGARRPALTREQAAAEGLE